MSARVGFRRPELSGVAGAYIAAWPVVALLAQRRGGGRLDTAILDQNDVHRPPVVAGDAQRGASFSACRVEIPGWRDWRRNEGFRIQIDDQRAITARRSGRVDIYFRTRWQPRRNG